VQACDRTNTSQDGRIKDELLAALILTMVCFAIEFFSFFSGVSMFNNNAGILCECNDACTAPTPCTTHSTWDAL